MLLCGCVYAVVCLYVKNWPLQRGNVTRHSTQIHIRMVWNEWRGGNEDLRFIIFGWNFYLLFSCIWSANIPWTDDTYPTIAYHTISKPELWDTTTTTMNDAFEQQRGSADKMFALTKSCENFWAHFHTHAVRLLSFSSSSSHLCGYTVE